MTQSPRRARVAQLVPTITRSGGGVSEAVRLLAHALVQRDDWDCEVHAIIAPGFEEARTQFEGTAVFGSKRRDSSRYGFSPGLVRGLLSSDADILHIHGLWGFHCLAARIWHLYTGKPYLITPHGMLEPWIMQRSRRAKALISAGYQNNLLKRAGAVHVLTDKECTDVNAVRPGLPLNVIPNFVEPPTDVDRLGPPDWWRPDMTGKTIFLFFGRIHEKKGCQELFNAWVRLCGNDSAFAVDNVLVFCGWNDGLAGFEDRVAGVGAALGNIVYAGPQFGDDKWRSLAAADFMVLPSKSEGLPLSILEAWALGVPAIMTPECNLPIGFAVGAALTCGYSVDGVAQGLAAAAALDADARTVLKASAMRLARSHFSRDAVASKIVNLYERVRQGGQRR